MATIVVTPEVLRSTAAAVQSDMEHATAIANGYLANQENVMGGSSWAGAGVQASYATVEQIHADLQKVLIGGSRLAEGLNRSAALMESHESDSEHAFHSLFGTTA
ncbi:WXG100 family type VII secretion target [Mycobacterium sp. M1]|uniref:WXG100 family type VII secretion target n=1 Tax=Mycolicibacter acidiphilus TaxID=2835306 RepID=A0ABS5RLL5_9MYCO|nr:WXG100 family type VII secretion target [Mycolicibacter acidiphilus]MBS9533824.1 WXG100 family type VII secretion target [Mycolicibacter acidiphilus]